MARSFFSEQECRDIGFSEPMIRTLRQIADFVALVDQTDSTSTDVASTAATLIATQARVTALEAIDQVLQDQGPAWTDPTGTAARTALASYAGQTVSATPTQAEVQAIDDAVKALSQHVIAIITDLKANGALT